MNKYMPGPWRYEKEVRKTYDHDSGAERTWTFHWICAADGSKAANSLDMTLLNGGDGDSANARLIAASPELLEVVSQLATDFAYPSRITTQYLSAMQGKLTALVAKATGGDA